MKCDDSLRGRIENLMERQISTWPFLSDNYLALNNLERKTFCFHSGEFRVQYNPARKMSSMASVDKQSINGRPCFLCKDNRPEVQEGVLWNDNKYEILVNPYPVFSKHFTIVSVNHRQQEIKFCSSHLFQLATELRGYTVFYNGPKCGASAPDHLHFQAVESHNLPLWDWIEASVWQNGIVEMKDLPAYRLTDIPVPLWLIKASDINSADKKFKTLLNTLIFGSDSCGKSPRNMIPEPMINILCRVVDNEILTVVIHRRCHRPSVYDLDSPEGMIISPASIDLGGVMVLPRKDDFDRFDSKILRNVIKEVVL